MLILQSSVCRGSFSVSSMLFPQTHIWQYYTASGKKDIQISDVSKQVIEKPYKVIVSMFQKPSLNDKYILILGLCRPGFYTTSLRTLKWSSVVLFVFRPFSVNLPPLIDSEDGVLWLSVMSACRPSPLRSDRAERWLSFLRCVLCLIGQHQEKDLPTMSKNSLLGFLK